MSEYETPQQRRFRLLQAQRQLEEDRQRIVTNRLLCVIFALSLLLMLALLRRYGSS